jgi:hypothetical protein
MLPSFPFWSFRYDTRRVCCFGQCTYLIICMVEPEVTTVTQTARPTICAQCQDDNRPVTEQVDGFSFHYEIIKGVVMEIFLHDDCACRWYDAFSALSPVIKEIRRGAAQAA